jgi:hypothetical protein
VYTYEFPVFGSGVSSRVQAKVASEGNKTTLNVTCSPNGIVTSFVIGVFVTMHPLSRATTESMMTTDNDLFMVPSP